MSAQPDPTRDRVPTPPATHTLAAQAATDAALHHLGRGQPEMGAGYALVALVHALLEHADATRFGRR